MSERNYCYVISIIFLLVFSCDSEKVLYEVKFSNPKLVETSFGKNSLFLKWNIKKTCEEIEAYAFSYGIVGGTTLRERMIVSSHTHTTGYKIEKLEEGKEYWFKVQAVYEKFSGPWSEVIQGMPGKPMPPADFRVEKNTQETKWYMDVSWKDHPSNAGLTIVGYKLECQDSADRTKKYAIFTKGYTANTKGQLETDGEARYVCSVQAETDTGIKSDVIKFHNIVVPELSATIETWGTPITFQKEADHSYSLKNAKDGVSLDTSKSPAEITANKSVSGVVVIARRVGYMRTAESAEIEFTRQSGDTFSFSQASYRHTFSTGTFEQKPTIADDVGDYRCKHR